MNGEAKIRPTNLLVILKFLPFGPLQNIALVRQFSKIFQQLQAFTRVGEVGVAFLKFRDRLSKLSIESLFARQIALALDRPAVDLLQEQSRTTPRLEHHGAPGLRDHFHMKTQSHRPDAQNKMSVDRLPGDLFPGLQTAFHRQTQLGGAA